MLRPAVLVVTLVFLTAPWLRAEAKQAAAEAAGG